MATKIHVVPQDDRWAVVRDGSDEPLSRFDTQAEAHDFGRDAASREGSELVIHGQDGQIRESDSFGNDPRDIPG